MKVTQIILAASLISTASAARKTRGTTGLRRSGMENRRFLRSDGMGMMKTYSEVSLCQPPIC